MNAIKQLKQSIVKDPTIFISICITCFLVFFLLSNHQWQNAERVDTTQMLEGLSEIEQKPEESSNNSGRVAKLPDFTQYKSVGEKKAAFFDYLRPMVRQENMKIRYDRAFLDTLANDFSESSHHDGATLRKLMRLAKSYHVKETDIKKIIEKLRLRIGPVPESLLLAQAAKESAWGTSRFATTANNLFGQWCYTKGCGIVPKERNKGARHEVRKFDSPQASVVSYMRNLNSHHAYLTLRKIRAELRKEGRKITGLKLVKGLSSYSEKGDIYVKELASIIRQNRLE